MVETLALYPTSMKKEKIDALFSMQIESMKKSAGIISIRVNQDHLMSPGGPPAYSRVLMSSWNSLESLMAWVKNQKPAEQAEKEFMLENKVTLLYFEVEEQLDTETD